MKYVTAAEAVAIIKSGDRIFIHSVAAPPQQLNKAMTARAPDVRSVEVYGRNLRQCAKALISIAQPAHRETLEREAFARFQMLYD